MPHIVQGVAAPSTPLLYHTILLYPSSTPLSFKFLNNSGSRNLLIVTSSARPFLLLVLSTKSRASACAVAGSRGRSLISLSSGSPGTMDQRSKTSERETWPCVWICGLLANVIALVFYGRLTLKSVSKPKESMTGMRPLTLYSGVPAMGPSCNTCPLLLARTVYKLLLVSAGPVMLHEYTGSINRGLAIRKLE